jgi:purine-binding chemotaxis protein CheW
MSGLPPTPQGREAAAQRGEAERGAGPREGRWDELARAAALRRGAPAAADALRQLLSVRVDGVPYAVPVENVREIVRVRPITPIPRVARCVRGVISLRGEIIQVIDLRLRLGLAPAAASKANRIVVVQAEDGRVAGVLVDEVREVLRVSESAIGSAASSDAQGIVAALCTNGAEFVSIVDPGRLLEVDGRD